MSDILITVLTLGLLGAVSAVVLYFVAQKFKVYEDPRIDDVEAVLPAANCGGCGFAGCRNFAEACVKAETLDGLLCPVGGNAVMTQVAAALGQEAVASDPKIAVVRCNGSCANRAHTNTYDGAQSCAIAVSLYSGETGCSFGCYGLGDCELSCQFDALYIDEKTKLPVIDEDKCTSCGACVKACPKMIIELRKKGPKSRRIYVSCANKDKGGVAKKACSVACIGCSKCQKVCAFEAISVENNLAYIDDTKCRLCRKCVAECPTAAIVELNFPPRKEKVEALAD
ncbi:MAG: Fe-S cluster domain-containing protein [Prevotellaceae bacterium]|jgi:RnfABCDGE-type electron transport complex B subunit|nr:Fe-S cluster domain-containing protein [Prevotellaceae bacterium]